MRSNVGFNDGFVLATVDGCLAPCKDRSVEHLLSEVGEVVGQQVFCVDVDVESEISQFLVMYAARQDTLVAIDVVDLTAYKLHLVRYHTNRVVAHLVGAPQSCNVGMSVE